MKKFTEICKMNQMELKSYLHKFLSANQYKVINEDGFLYAKGTVPVLLLAHMDTVHTSKITEIKIEKGIYSSPQGIGGDDRCGIWAIMNIIKEKRCSVLFLEEEEKGAKGATKFTNTEHINNLDVNYMVELDRKGKDEAVFYYCDNKEFTDFITKETEFKVEFGTLSDISVVAPAAKIAAVNLSVGYYKQHTKSEYVNYAQMMNTVEVVKKLVEVKVDKPFEYVAKKQTMAKPYYSSWDWENYFTKTESDNSFTKRLRKESRMVQIEVLYEDWTENYGDELCGFGEGLTKAEAWLDFFLKHGDVCMDQVNDYYFT